MATIIIIDDDDEPVENENSLNQTIRSILTTLSDEDDDERHMKDVDNHKWLHVHFPSELPIDHFVKIIQVLCRFVQKHKQASSWSSLFEPVNNDDHSMVLLSCRLTTLSKFIRDAILYFIASRFGNAVSNDGNGVGSSKSSSSPKDKSATTTTLKNNQQQLLDAVALSLNAYEMCCSSERELSDVISRFVSSHVCVLLVSQCQKTMTHSVLESTISSMIHCFSSEMNGGATLAIEEIVIRTLQQNSQMDGLINLFSKCAINLMKDICRKNRQSYVYCIGDSCRSIIDRFLFLYYHTMVSNQNTTSSLTDLLDKIIEAREVHMAINWSLALHYQSFVGKTQYSMSNYLLSAIKRYDAVSILDCIRHRFSRENVYHIQVVIIPLLSAILTSDEIQLPVQKYCEEIRREALDKFPSIPVNLLKPTSDISLETNQFQCSILDSFRANSSCDAIMKLIDENHVNIYEQLLAMKQDYLVKWRNNTALLGPALQLFNLLHHILSSNRNFSRNQLEFKKMFMESFHLQPPSRELSAVLDVKDNPGFNDLVTEQRIFQFLCSGNLVDTTTLAKIIMKQLFVQQVQDSDQAMKRNVHTLLSCCMRIFKNYASFFISDGLITAYTNLLRSCIEIARSSNELQMSDHKWVLFAPTEIVLVYSETSKLHNNIWRHIFNDVMCNEVYPTSIVSHLAQYVISRYTPSLDKIIGQVGTLNHDLATLSDGFWCNQSLFHRFEWLSDIYCGPDVTNIIGWWQHFRGKVVKQLGQNLEFSPIEPHIKSAQKQSKNAWISATESCLFTHDPHYQQMPNLRCRQYYLSLFSKPGFRCWLYWTLSAYTRNPTHIRATQIRDIINNLYLPYYFDNRCSRFLSALFVELTKILPIYLSKQTNEPRLPSELIDLISEYCLSIGQNTEDFTKVKQEEKVDTNQMPSFSKTQPSSTMMESMWFLNVLKQFPNNSTQDMKDNLLIVLEVVFKNKCSPLFLLPRLANSTLLPQISTAIKMLLLEKPFLMHSAFISIVVQWAYSINYGLPVLLLFDIEKQLQSSVVSSFCEQCSSHIKHWIRQNIQIKHPQKLRGPNTIEPTSSGESDSHTTDLNNNLVWQSWASFQETTSSNHERKRKRTNSQIAYLSPPRTKRFKSRINHSS